MKEQAALQQRLPRDQRREVPTYAELAEGAGVTQQSVFRLANQAYLTQLPLKLAYRVMRVLRGRGFQVGVGDSARHPQAAIPTSRRAIRKELAPYGGWLLDVSTRGAGCSALDGAIAGSVL